MADRTFRVKLWPALPPAPARPESPADPLVARDCLGRQEPHKLMFARILRGMPWMLEKFTHEVPARMLQRVENRHTDVACPCGETVSIEPGYSRVCDCNRHYFHAGSRVLVAPANTR